MNMYLNDPSNPIYSASKGKLKREQFEKLKGKKLKGNMSLPVNFEDFQRSLVSFTTCWYCFPPLSLFKTVMFEKPILMIWT